MRIVEIELSVLRLSALLTSAIRPVATCETSAMTSSGPVRGLLAVEVLGRLAGHPLGQVGPGHQRLDVGPQRLDRVVLRVS
jgi:hypothetical protein